MRLGRGWIVVAAVAALLVAGVAGNALAHSPTDAADGGETYSWEEMHAWCHGTGGAGAYYDGGAGTYYDQVTLTRIAGVLGLTAGELSARLSAGETVADVAQAQGVALEAVVETLIAPYRDQLQVAVTYGYLTPEQADALLQQRVEWLEARLTGTVTTYGGYGQYHGEMMGGGGSGGMMGGSGGMMGSFGGGMGRGSGMMGGSGGMTGGFGGGMGWGGGMMGGW